MPDLLALTPQGVPLFAPPFAGEHDARSLVTTALKNIAGLGIGDDPPGRLKAYLDLLFFNAQGDPQAIKQARTSFSNCARDKNDACAKSSCAMVIRSLWNLFGANDPILNPLRLSGTVMIDLQIFAAQLVAQEPVSVEEVRKGKGQIYYSELRRLKFPPPHPPQPPAPPPVPADDANVTIQAEYLEQQAAYLNAKRQFLADRATFELERTSYQAFLVQILKRKAAEPAAVTPATPEGPEVQPEQLDYAEERARFATEQAFFKKQQTRASKDLAAAKKLDVTSKVENRKGSPRAPLVRPDGPGFSVEQIMDLDPQPGDVILIYKGSSQHIFMIAEPREPNQNLFLSVDGGNPVTSKDGGCCGINNLRRTLPGTGTAIFHGDKTDRPIQGFFRFQMLIEHLAFGDSAVLPERPRKGRGQLVPTKPTTSDETPGDIGEKPLEVAPVGED